MGREAALSAKLTLDDSDLKKKIAAQPGNYATMLKAQRSYEAKAAAERKSGLQQQLAAEKDYTRARVAEVKKVTEAELRANREIAAARLQRATTAQAEMNRPALVRSDGGRGRTATGGFTAEQIGRLADGPGVVKPRTFTGNGGQGGATNAGMGMLMLSQTLDDLQYGLRGVVNNIAPLVMSLGGSTGLAGVLTIGAVAVNVLGKAFDDTGDKIREANRLLRDYEEIQRMVSKAVGDAEARGAATGRGAADRVAATVRTRAASDQWAAREQRVAEIRKEAALTETDNLSQIEKLKARAAINAQAEAEAMAASRDIVERRLRLDQEYADANEEKRKAALEELKILRAQRDEAEAVKAAEISRMEQELALKKANRATNPLMAAMDGALDVGNAIVGGSDRNPFAGEEALIEARRKMGTNFAVGSQMRLAELEASMAGLDEAAAGLAERVNEGKLAVVDLALAEAEMANNRAREQDELNAEMRRKFRQLLGDVAEMGNGLSNAFRKSGLGDFIRGLGGNDPRADQRKDAQRKLAIDEERARGNFRRADRMERADAIARRTEELRKMNFSPEEAAAMAEREADARRPRSGIRSTGRVTGASGLVDLRENSAISGGVNDPFGLKKAAHERAAHTASALADVKKAGEGTGGADSRPENTGSVIITLMKTLSSQLEKIAGNTAGTAAEALAPANRAQ